MADREVSRNPGDGEGKKAAGFTTLELVVAFLLFGIIISSAVGLLMSQRNLYSVQADKIAVQMNVRAAADLVAAELRSVPAGAVVRGRPDSLIVRYPFRWGLVCNYANKIVNKDGTSSPAPDAEIYIPVNDDGLYSGYVQDGIAFRDTAGVWNYIPDATEPWEDSLYVESTVICAEGPGSKVNKDTFDKEGNLIAAGDTANPNYRRWFGYLTYTGEEAYMGAQVVAYSTVTYVFAPSEFEPGTRGLFRVTSAGRQELAGLFNKKAAFSYVLQDGTEYGTLPGGHEDELMEVHIRAFGTVANQAGGINRAVNYDATVNVALRNTGEEE